MIALLLPMIENFLPPSTSQVTNSRNRLNGGLVMTMSASSRSAVTSALRKSPSPSRYSHWRSSMLMTPSPLMSFGSRMNFLPLARVLVASNAGLSVSNSVGW